MAGIGFFAPLPLAMMLPFMAGQSMIMGDAFGQSYQYGKRKISAMSNEEFNKLTHDDIQKDIIKNYKQMIPNLADGMVASNEFQRLIIQEIAKIIPTLPSDVTSGIFGGIQGLAKEAAAELNKLIPSIPEAHASPGKSGTTNPVSTVTPETLAAETVQVTPSGKTAAEVRKEKLLTSGVKPVTKEVITKPLSRGNQAIQNALVKYFTQYNNGLRKIANIQKTLKNPNMKHPSMAGARAQYLREIDTIKNSLNRNAIPIFNSKLAQAKRIKELIPAWGNINKLQLV